MRGEEIRENFVSQLIQLYSEREVHNIFYLIIDHVFEMDRVQWSTNRTESEESRLKEFIDQNMPALKQGKPIQQVLGSAWFYDLQLMVNDHVLIPRPETEELVQWILDSESANEANWLDIGTGSGCIPLALASKRLQVQVYGWDVSEEAIALANVNRDKLGLENTTFELQDILMDPPSREWDLIVSNPPYIPLNEAETLDQNVRDYEPDVALFVPNNDALLFYSAISDYALNNLTTKGVLYFECHENYADGVAKLMKEKGFKDVELKKDLQYKDRMVRGRI